jgi:hypothetical protein
MNPAETWNATKPSNHNTTNTAAIIPSISVSLCLERRCPVVAGFNIVVRIAGRYGGTIR